MRRTRLILALPIILFTACNQQLIETTQETGEVVFSLSADERTDIVSVKSGTETPLPDVGDFWVEIINSENVTFKREKYSDIEGKSINFNAGNFTMLAKHGNPLGVGFNKPYYQAEQAFTVEPHKQVTVNAVAKLANVKVAVNYGPQIVADYTDYYAEVKHADYKKTSLVFEKDETRAGYIPAGNLMVTVYATINGELKCFTLKDSEGNPKLIECQPNDFITFNVNTRENFGDLAFSVKIDNGTELVEKNFFVPADVVSSDLKPTILYNAFDTRGDYYINEGVETKVEDMGFTYKAYAGLQECVLTIDCDYMDELGIPSEIDLVSLDEAGRKALEDKGFFFAQGGGIGVIDFADFVPGISKASEYNGIDTNVATFSLRIKDNNGAATSKEARILINNVTAAIQVQNHNVWAKKIIDPVLTLANASNPSLAKIEVSMDGSSWYDYKAVTSNPFNMGTHADLTPGTAYHYRVLYRGHTLISEPVVITTETSAQLGNSGFEDFQCVDFLYTPQAGSQTAEPWYLPWKANESDIWWDVNSKRTLRKSPTVAYQNYKCYPTVTYIVDGVHGGSKAAQIASVATGQSASEIAKGTSYPGEIFIGRSNDKHQDDWGYASTGHSFPSRPASFSFWYQYESLDGDNFYVKIEVRNAAGNVIASAEKNDGAAASGWTQCTMNLNYTDLNSKAASIFVTFKSSTDSSPDTKKRKLTYYNSDNENHYVGSVLRIDDLQLVY